MAELYSFGEWVKQRRKAQHLTQRELALKAACAVATIKKIEADERRPSVEIAELLAKALAVPESWRDRFVASARGQRAIDTLDGMDLADHVQTARSLPHPPTPFIGRETELAHIIERLDQPACRLLTLVGPGGIGKTRLAIETAFRLHDTLADGTLFVPLAAITDANAIPSAIANSLNLSATNDDQLFGLLHPLQMLIVVDNCEQLGDGSAWFATLLQAVPGIQLLATSRERLQLRDEWVYVVPEMATEQATVLLQKTGERNQPDLSVSHQDAASVCEVVENLPLAVELAAGWLRFMDCQQIVQSIQRDVDFLATNMRDVPERHRSIRAVFDYSWKMLSAQEQNALMRLSVFRGGWRAEQAEQVADSNLLLLRALLDKSLVRAAGDGRYDLHELIRQYAAQQLSTNGLEDATHERHLLTYVRSIDHLLMTYGEQNMNTAFNLIEDELPNARVALRWALDHDKPALALQLCSALYLTWLRNGYWQEGERWCKEALDAIGDDQTTLVCMALIAVGTFSAVQGRFAEAFPYRMRAEAIARVVDDPLATMAVAEQALQAEHQLEDARAWFEVFVSHLEQWDHPLRIGRLASAYCMFGDRLRDSGYFAEAEDHYRKSLEIDTALVGLMTIYAYGNLGRLATQAGDFEQAYDRISYTVAKMRASGSRVHIADWTRALGEALLYMGDLEEAEGNFEESLALYQEIGNVRASADLLSYLAHIATLQSDWDGAVERLQAALPIYIPILDSVATGHVSEYITPFTNGLFCLGIIAEGNGQPERAATIMGYAAQLHQQDSRRSESQLMALVTTAVQRLRTQLGDTRYDTHTHTGRVMSVGDLLAYAVDCLRNL